MNKIKNTRKGFTLIEMLVVVLIVGILAAIALPQYKMAVAKSKLSTIKDMTNALHHSVERYYLATSMRPNNLEGLDIDMPGEYTNSSKIRKVISEGVICGLNTGTSEKQEVICFTPILGKDIDIALINVLYFKQSITKKMCLAFSLDTTDLVNKLCQIESNKNANKAECSSGEYCLYRY